MLNNIPLVIDCFGVPFRVEYKIMDGEGETYMDEAVIYINPHYPEEAQRMTLVHEIAHIVFQYRLRYTCKVIVDIKNDDDREHLIIDNYANGIHEILRDNPQLRKLLYGD